MLCTIVDIRGDYAYVKYDTTGVTSAPTSSTTPTISCPTVMPGTARGTLPCLICRSLEQMLPIVTRTIASVGSNIVGFGFSTKANFPFSMYVYASINTLLYHQHNPSFCLDKHIGKAADNSINLIGCNRLAILADM